MRDTKKAVLFLVVFVSIYVGLNILYGLWISSYQNQPDPITYSITKQTSVILNLMGEATIIQPALDKPSVNVLKHERKIIGVYEGCNSINVIIVFVAFIVAFKGSWKYVAWFIPLGSFIIYMANLIRVAVLYLVAAYWSHYFYYFHKYLFTAFIYFIVFMLWLWWMKLSHGITLKSLFSKTYP
ncbi:MAG: exosortase family protein XrtF [Cyclobacteriaceae bacterium]|nr:exosortase family protein XrtF [Cyclobacteriaceae bacterium]